MAKKLSGIEGLRVPRTIACQAVSPEDVLRIAAEHEIDTPFLIRESGQHGGNTLLKIDGRDEAGLLHRLAYDGRDFYITEFVDFRSPDGYFRKHRAVVVDGKPYMRHVIVANDWKIHAAQRQWMEERPELMEEESFEMSQFENELKPVIEPIAQAAAQALKLDFFGIDACFSRDGDAVLFEANPNMNIIRNTRPHMQPYIDLVIDALAELIRRRLGTQREQRPAPA